MAVKINARIVARLWLILLSVKASTGKRLIIPTATAIPPTYTPIKFHIPDQITATFGFKEWV
jgi:hypothetical protein